MTKIFKAFLVAMAVVTIIGLAAAFILSDYNTKLAQAAIQDEEILKTKFFKFEFEAPKPSMAVIYLAKNTSSADVEVIYDLTSEIGLGGIEAIIDSDGPFGPKEPEPYHWKKVPLAGNGDQYVIVTFPLPDGWTSGTKVIPSVRLVRG